MLRNYIFKTLLFVFASSPLFAQNTAWFELNQSYKSGIELIEHGKFAAAAGQFNQIEKSLPGSSVAAEATPEISLLKENAQYFLALCALELGNDDAESLFLKFIAQHPVNSNTKLAFYQVGRSYFAKRNFAKVVEWLTKLDNNSLSGKESAEYRFKLGYSYFELKDYKNAEPLFAQLKNEQNVYTEQSIYYYAYLNYLSKNYRVALTEFERLKGSKAYENSYPYYISALYFLDKRYDDVIRYAAPILKSSKQLYETEMFRIIGASYFAKSDYTNAGTYYQSFQQKDLGKTQNNQDNYQIGYTFLKLKNYNKAIIELEKLSSNDDYFQNGMIALGESFLKKPGCKGRCKTNYRKSINTPE